MPELTIAAVEVEAVRGPAGRFPYPEQWQAVPLDVCRAPGEPKDAPAAPGPAAITEARYVTITTRQGPRGRYGPVAPAAAWPLTRIYALAETFGVPVIPHGHGLHAALHVIASQSPGTCPMAEYLSRIAPGRHRFEAMPPEPSGGSSRCPGAPGSYPAN